MFPILRTPKRTKITPSPQFNLIFVRLSPNSRAERGLGGSVSKIRRRRKGQNQKNFNSFLYCRRFLFFKGINFSDFDGNFLETLGGIAPPPAGGGATDPNQGSLKRKFGGYSKAPAKRYARS